MSEQQQFQLSEVKCNKTFKNILRAEKEDNYKEHRMIPFKEKDSIVKKDNRSIFDDTYNMKSHNTQTKSMKFENHYLKGNLKSNIIFDDTPVRNIKILLVKQL
jgi:hypothetical protein